SLGGLNTSSDIRISPHADIYHALEEILESTVKRDNLRNRRSAMNYDRRVRDFLLQLQAAMRQSIAAPEATKRTQAVAYALSRLAGEGTGRGYALSEPAVKIFAALHLGAGLGLPFIGLIAPPYMASIREASKTIESLPSYRGFVEYMSEVLGAADAARFKLLFNPMLSEESEAKHLARLQQVLKGQTPEAVDFSAEEARIREVARAQEEATPQPGEVDEEDELPWSTDAELHANRVAEVGTSPAITDEAELAALGKADPVEVLRLRDEATKKAYDERQVLYEAERTEKDPTAQKQNLADRVRLSAHIRDLINGRLDGQFALQVLMTERDAWAAHREETAERRREEAERLKQAEEWRAAKEAEIRAERAKARAERVAERKAQRKAEREAEREAKAEAARIAEESPRRGAEIEAKAAKAEAVKVEAEAKAAEEAQRAEEAAARKGAEIRAEIEAQRKVEAGEPQTPSSEESRAMEGMEPVRLNLEPVSDEELAQWEADAIKSVVTSETKKQTDLVGGKSLEGTLAKMARYRAQKGQVETATPSVAPVGPDAEGRKVYQTRENIRSMIHAPDYAEYLLTVMPEDMQQSMKVMADARGAGVHEHIVDTLDNLFVNRLPTKAEREAAAEVAEGEVAEGDEAGADPELGILRSGEDRSLHLLQDQRGLAAVMESITGQHGHQALFELVWGKDTAEPLRLLLSSPELYQQWMDGELLADGPQTLKHLRAMVALSVMADMDQLFSVNAAREADGKEPIELEQLHHRVGISRDTLLQGYAAVESLTQMQGVVLLSDGTMEQRNQTSLKDRFEKVAQQNRDSYAARPMVFWEKVVDPYHKWLQKVAALGLTVRGQKVTEKSLGVLSSRLNETTLHQARAAIHEELGASRRYASQYPISLELMQAIQEKEPRLLGELAQILENLTGAPRSFFISTLQSPKGLIALTSMIGKNFQYALAPDVDMRRINSDLSRKSTLEKAAVTDSPEYRKAVNKFFSDAWVSTTTLGAADAVTGEAKPTADRKSNLDFMLDATTWPETGTAPTFDAGGKQQAGWLQRGKLERYLHKFLEIFGVDGWDKDDFSLDNPGAVSPANLAHLGAVTTAAGEEVATSDANFTPAELLWAVREMEKAGYFYTGVYSDKINKRFVKVKWLPAQQAYDAYVSWYKDYSSRLVAEQAALMHPNELKAILDEYNKVSDKKAMAAAAQKAQRALDAAKSYQASVAEGGGWRAARARQRVAEAERALAAVYEAPDNLMRALNRPLMRGRLVQILDGDLRYYFTGFEGEAKELGYRKMSELSREERQQMFGNIEGVQATRAKMAKALSKSLDTLFKRRGNDLTGGYSGELMAPYFAQLPGHNERGDLRAIHIYSEAFDASQDGGIYHLDTLGRAMVETYGSQFAGSEDVSWSIKYQISGVDEKTGMPRLVKMHSQRLQLRADQDALFQELLRIGKEHDIDIVILSSSEKVPTKAIYEILGTEADDRISVNTFDDLGKMSVEEISAKVREVPAADIIIPLALHGDGETKMKKFAKQLLAQVGSFPTAHEYEAVLSDWRRANLEEAGLLTDEGFLELVIKHLERGDPRSKDLAAGLRSGTMTLHSAAVQGNLKVMSAVKAALNFKVPRRRGVVMTSLRGLLGDMRTEERVDGFSRMVANMKGNRAAYPDVALETNKPNTALSNLAQWWAKQFLKINKKSVNLIANPETALRNMSAILPAVHMFPLYRGAEPMRLDPVNPETSNILATSVDAEGNRYLDPRQPIIYQNPDGSIDPRSFAEDVLFIGEDGNYKALGMPGLADRIPADGFNSAMLHFLQGEFEGHPEVDGLLLDALAHMNAGGDDDGDASNVVVPGGLLDNSAEGLANQFIHMLVDDLMRNPDVREWAQRGIGELTKMDAEFGEELKYSDDAPIKPPILLNSDAREEFELKAGSVGKKTVGAAAKTNSAMQRILQAGGYTAETDADLVTLTMASGRKLTFGRTKKQAQQVLEDISLWHRARMAMHVGPQREISSSVDDGKFLTQGIMGFTTWVKSFVATALALNQELLQPALEGRERNVELEKQEALEVAKELIHFMAYNPTVREVNRRIEDSDERMTNPEFRKRSARSTLINIGVAELSGRSEDHISSQERAAWREHWRKISAKAAETGVQLDQYKAKVSFILTRTELGKLVQLVDIAGDAFHMGRVSDLWIGDADVRTLEDLGSYQESLRTVKGEFEVYPPSIKYIRPEVLTPAEQTLDVLQGLAPKAFLAATPVGEFVRGRLGPSASADRISRAIGSTQALITMRRMREAWLAENPGESLKASFVVQDILDLRNEFKDNTFLQLIWTGGNIKGILQIDPGYAGAFAGGLSDAQTRRAQRDFDRLPRKVQLELATAILAGSEPSSGARARSPIQLMGSLESSEFLRDFAKVEAEVHERLTRDAGAAYALAEYVVETLSHPGYARVALARGLLGPHYAVRGGRTFLSETERAAWGLLRMHDIDPGVVGTAADAVRGANPPNSAARKEAAKAGRATGGILAPTTAQAASRSFAARLGDRAAEQGLLITDPARVVPGSYVYVSVPGRDRGFAAKDLQTLITTALGVLQQGGQLITDNEAKATTPHNAEGEGVLRKALIDAGAVETAHDMY
ncbi:MAG: hypothetical protein ACOYCB_10825, partial [Fastidiosipilaceae bacterium]